MGYGVRCIRVSLKCHHAAITADAPFPLNPAHPPASFKIRTMLRWHRPPHTSQTQHIINARDADVARPRACCYVWHSRTRARDYECAAHALRCCHAQTVEVLGYQPSLRVANARLPSCPGASTRFRGLALTSLSALQRITR